MYQVALGLVLVFLAACLLAWSAIALRNPRGKPWTRKTYVAEFLAILLIAVFASGAGVLMDFLTGLSGAEAYSWAVGLAVAVPLIFAAVWWLSGAHRRLAAWKPASSGGAANDHSPRAARRRAA